MTTAAGDALSQGSSQSLLRRFFEAIFSANRPSQICPPTDLHVTNQGKCSTLPCMASMSHLQEPPLRSSHSLHRITCRGLVATKNDFSKQYYKVIIWLIIY
jgi:hypothetical protein